MRALSLVSTSEARTRAIGHWLGEHLLAGDCLALAGEMGAGKTVIAQGAVAGAGGVTSVRSPTFVLHAVHPGRITVHHLDLYRLEPGLDLRQLGIDEALEDGCAVVEWPERSHPEWFTGEVRVTIVEPSVRRLELRLPDHFQGAP
ncbi:MAG: tRNA (adenosine(37)-N6)-threonylcarbamoyltransferase complex ATPase subunit type 1 TsaE [Candidatus Dormibacteria bacterium]